MIDRMREARINQTDSIAENITCPKVFHTFEIAQDILRLFATYFCRHLKHDGRPTILLDQNLSQNRILKFGSLKIREKRWTRILN